MMPHPRVGWLGIPMVLFVGVALVATQTERGDSVARSERAHTETLMGASSFTPLPPDTSVTLQRIIYKPGESLDLESPGPIMLYIDEGQLAVPESSPGQPIVISYSGSPDAMPPTSYDHGDEVLPPGYGLVGPTGKIGKTRNPGSESTTVLAIFLTPQHSEEGTVVVQEATAASKP